MVKEQPGSSQNSRSNAIATNQDIPLDDMSKATDDMSKATDRNFLGSVLTTTKELKEASPFFVSHNQDGQNEYEFSIQFHPDCAPPAADEDGQTVNSKKGAMPAAVHDGKREAQDGGGGGTENNTKRAALYVYAPVTFRGRNRGDLTLQLQADNRHTSLTLHSRRRIGKSHPAVDIDEWMQGEDIFYIRCKQRSVGWNSYICVKNDAVRCVNNIEEFPYQYKLFRLLDYNKYGYPALS